MYIKLYDNPISLIKLPTAADKRTFKICELKSKSQLVHLRLSVPLVRI